MRLGVILGFILSILGVDRIMEISIPILLFIYPIVISLYVLNLFDNGSIDSLIYKIVTFTVGLVSLSDSLKALGMDNAYISFIEKLPLGAYGFAFVFVFILSFVIASIISKLKNY